MPQTAGGCQSFEGLSAWPTALLEITLILRDTRSIGLCLTSVHAESEQRIRKPINVKLAKSYKARVPVYNLEVVGLTQCSFCNERIPSTAELTLLSLRRIF